MCHSPPHAGGERLETTMHVLAITVNDVATPHYGGALRVAHLLHGLREHGADVSVIRLRPRGAPPSAAGGPFAVHDIPLPPLGEMAAVAALTAALGRRVDRLARRIHAGRPITVVQADVPWAALVGARVARALGARLVALAHNCETDLAAQMAAGPARRLPGLGPLVTRLNLAVLRAAEARALAVADMALTPAEQDRAAMARLGMAAERVGLLPNGTAVRQPEPGLRATARRELGLAEDAPVAIFVGRMDYPPNRAAAEAICAQIAPRCPDVTFLLVGYNPPPLAAPPNVRVLGGVPAVEPFLAAADLAVVPVREGSGTRIKILDAWAAGLPVIATPAGASGLSFQPGEQILIEPAIERFAARVAALLADHTLMQRLAAGALEAARPYSWATIGRRYAGALTGLSR